MESAIQLDSKKEEMLRDMKFGGDEDGEAEK